MAKAKYTILRARSVAKGVEKVKEIEKNIRNLEGIEKVKYDTEMIKARIFNVKYDIKSFGNNTIFKKKLFEMENNLKSKEEELVNLMSEKEVMKDG